MNMCNLSDIDIRIRIQNLTYLYWQGGNVDEKSKARLEDALIGEYPEDEKRNPKEYEPRVPDDK